MRLQIGRSFQYVQANAACRNETLLLYAILNACWEPLEFELPPLRNGYDSWHRWIDTNLD
jgi:hypothetical protein